MSWRRRPALLAFSVATHRYVRPRSYTPCVEFFVPGGEPEFGRPRTSYRSWALASPYASEREEYYLLINDEPVGEAAARLRAVRSANVIRHHRGPAPARDESGQ